MLVVDNALWKYSVQMYPEVYLEGSFERGNQVKRHNLIWTRFPFLGKSDRFWLVVNDQQM